MFESVILPYCLLAPSVVFFLLDHVWPRWSTRPLSWCAATAFFVAVHPGNRAIEAVGTFAFAALAVGAGVATLVRPVASPRQPVMANARSRGAPS